MKKFESNPKLFKTRAKEMLVEAAQSKGLTVWDGEYAGFFSPSDETFDCLIVGIGDATKPPEKSGVTLAITFVRRNGQMAYEDDSQSGVVPFGGGWHPLEILGNRLIPELPDFSC